MSAVAVPWRKGEEGSERGDTWKLGGKAATPTIYFLEIGGEGGEY
jgi:hypothetical protein